MALSLQEVSERGREGGREEETFMMVLRLCTYDCSVSSRNLTTWYRISFCRGGEGEGGGRSYPSGTQTMEWVHW